jgi:hypothetical protein
MEGTEDDWQIELLKALAGVLANAKGVGIAETLEMYQGVLDRFLPFVEGNEFRQQETRRRVAEFMLYSGAENRFPLSICRHLFEDLFHLGFLSPDKRWRMALVFSWYCLESRHAAEGIRVMAPIEIELEEGFREQHALLTAGGVPGSIEDEKSRGPREQASVLQDDLLQRLFASLQVVEHEAAELTCDGLTDAYTRIETGFSERAANALERLAVKACVAYAALGAAVKKQCPFELCRRLADSAMGSGPVNLDTKIPPLLSYCDYADRLGRTEVAEDALDKLQAELEAQGKAGDGSGKDERVKAIRMLQYYRFNLVHVRRRLAELRCLIN